MDKSALKKLNYQLDYSNELKSHINEHSTTAEDFFADTLSLSLRLRLVEWLFSGRGWHVPKA